VDFDLRPTNLDLDLDLQPMDLDLDLTISESEDLDLEEEDSDLDLDLPPWDLTTTLSVTYVSCTKRKSVVQLQRNASKM